MIHIIPYEHRFHDEFRRLNLEWLNEYHLLESHDQMVLDDPEGTILERGGFIWLAKHESEIIGSAALMKDHDGVYELAKMAVTKAWQGKGISKMLIDRCLKKAKQLNATKITLFSNHQLEAALRLYQKYGFRSVDVEDSPFETADVKMELNL